MSRKHALVTPRLPTSVAEAYDSIASEYDRQLEDDAWIRQVLWKHYDRVFCPGQRVLDVGCGTGTDAVFLAQRGIWVTGIDIAPGMIAQAERKVASYGLLGALRLAVLDIGDVSNLPAEDFDGIISSFAALNTLPTLTQFAADAARLLKPRGRMILHLLNGSSLWERASLIGHGQFAEARQRSRGHERTLRVGGYPIQHYMPRADEVYARHFASHFRLCRASSVGIVRPASPISHMPGAILSVLGRLDDVIGSRYPCTNWGRFVVLELTKDVGEEPSVPHP